MTPSPKDKSEHAKDKRHQVPMDLPGVKPEDYPQRAVSVPKKPVTTQ